jgi:hypothetical protein
VFIYRDRWHAFVQTLLQWKKILNTYSECVFIPLASSMQWACAKLPVPCPAMQYFSILCHKGHDFRRKLLSVKYVFWFCLRLSSETFSHSKKNWAEYDQNWILVFMQSARYSCQILVKRVFSTWILVKHSGIKFYENSSNGGPNCPMRTDRQTWRS